MLKGINNPQLLSALKSANSILLCTHVSPDGDAIGSTLATYLMLNRLGKTVFMADEHSVPEYLRFLPCADRIMQPYQLRGKRFDAALSIDVADEKRMGACINLYNSAPVRLQIDHHPTNPNYAMQNEVDGKACAAGQIVLRLIHAMGVPISKDMATCLYAAISSDTGNFCFDSVDDETFEGIAELMRAGLELNVNARKLHLIRNSKHVMLLGRALNTLHFFGDGKLTGMHVTKEDYDMCGAEHEHADKIVNYGLDMQGVVMTYFADDTNLGVKFSLRALPPYDVSAIAQQFGGGGHVLASGCTMDCPLDEAKQKMESAMLAQLQEK